MKHLRHSWLVIIWWLAVGVLGFFSYESRHFWIAAIVWFIGGIILATMVERWTTAEKRVNRLEHARRKQSEFIALAVHELNTPLAALRGRLDMLLNENLAELSRRQTKQFTPVQTAADRLDYLVSDLLDASRIDAGRFRIRQEAVDWREILNECWQEVNPLLNKDAAHRLNLPAGKLPYRGDPTRLKQVIRNLLSNAAKYANGGPVGLTLKKSPEKYTIIIKDRGAGIDPQEIPKLTQKFWQSESPNRQPGTGLGLYIVRQLVVAHGGHLTFESDGIDEGMTVTIDLPINH